MANPKEGDPDGEAEGNWKKVVELVRMCFEGEIPKAHLYGVLVIIPKDDKGGVRGIGLLEAIHKLVSCVINMRIQEKVSFYEEVHGFREKRGCITAVGESKIRIQIATCRSETTYQVYLDLRKAYDSIDRDRTLAIMAKYGIGPRILRYIGHVWDSQRFLLRQQGFYSEEIEIERGCTQGDINSPSIFNLVVDAVIRAAKKDPNYGGTRLCFYADDGLLEDRNPEVVQKDLDLVTHLFKRCGLETNEVKTKLMVVRGTQAPTARTQNTYNQMMGGEKRGPNWLKEKTECPECGKVMQNASLRRHLTTIHKKERETYQCRKVEEKGTYNASVERGRFNKCPVEGCEGGGQTGSPFCSILRGGTVGAR